MMKKFELTFFNVLLQNVDNMGNYIDHADLILLKFVISHHKFLIAYQECVTPSKISWETSPDWIGPKNAKCLERNFLSSHSCKLCPPPMTL